MTRTMVLIALGIAAAGAVHFAQGPAASHAFTQIAPGIYSAVGTGTPNAGSNSAVIVNQDDVVVVDSHISPESGRALLRDLRAITDKPVRFVINTHFHYDHTNGNQVFAPIADIIGHDYTRKRLAGDILQKGMFADLLARLATSQEAFAQQIRETRPTPPNLTIDDHLTLFRGDREIRLLYVGPGHTGGDLVVYLPKERVLCTGDLLVNQIANLVDGYVDVWPAALEKLRGLDFVDVIPGHGEPFKGKDRIDWFQAYLRDLWQQTSRLHTDGIPAAEAARRIDMTAHTPHYASINGPGVPLLAVARMYAVMEGRAD